SAVSARASSSSRSAGRWTSRSPLRCAGRGKTMSAFDPKESIVPETTRVAPSASATTIVTAVMPTRIPNAVSAQRTGLCRIAEKARTTAVQARPSMLLMAQRLHRLDLRGATGRKKAEEQSDDQARRERDEHGGAAELHRPSEK